MKKLIEILLPVLIAVMFLTACGGGGGDQDQAPSTPTGVKAEKGNRLARISWNAASGATSYNLYWSTSGTVSKTTGTRISGAANPYEHANLSNGVTYYYVVTTVNRMGESTESSPVSATPTDATPSAPTGLTAASGNNQVALTWPVSLHASSYKVYRGASTGDLSSKTVISTTFGVSYTDTSVDNGTTYYYQITAANLNGESAGSSEVNAMPAIPPAPLIKAIVTSYSGTNIADAEVTITNYSTGARIGNATVVINGSQLPYDDIYTQKYAGKATVNPGDTVSLSVTDAGVTYAESLTMYSIFPSIMIPVSGVTWDGTKSYTSAWSASSPVPPLWYYLDVYRGSLLSYQTVSKSTYVTIPANSLPAGTYRISVRVSDATPISNAAAQSQFDINAISLPVTISVQ